MNTHLPKKTSPSHGGVRGADFNRRSSQFEGRFGRIFRSLPAATWSEDALRKLAGDGQAPSSMSAEPERDPTNPQLPTAPREDIEVEGTEERPRTNRLHDAEENSSIDAGYTYLGQFIDHDITFDPASSLQKRNDVDALVDFRTPALDLDSLYGSGPDDQPYIYSANGRKFQLGRDLLEGIGGKPIGKDLPRHSWDDEDGTKYNRALIGDKRNDENVIVSQLHSVFLQFHNRLADDNPSWDFATIQRQVRWHYQYVVLHDFLPKITNSEVYSSVLPHIITGASIHEHPPRLLFYKPKNEAFMPIEFAAAAYRFGHSMVRPIYRLNQRLTGGNNPPSDPTIPNEQQRGINGRQFIFAGIPARGLNGFDAFPQEWGIDWNLFFDLTGDKEGRVAQDRTQPSYKIDTSLVNPLAFLPEFSAIDKQPPLDDIKKLQPDPLPPLPKQFNNLAFRNLLRGMAMSLPSGQDVARAMGYQPLQDEELKVGKATTQAEYDALSSIIEIDEDFIDKAPLWFYVLAEAAHEWRLDGGHPETPVTLGKVGSRIVLETFVGLLINDGHSLLRQAPAWVPEIGKRDKFDMPDLIKYALNINCGS